MPLIFIPNLTMWDMKKYYSIDQKMIGVENTVRMFRSIQRNNLYPLNRYSNNNVNTITNLITVSFRNNAYRDLMPKIC